MKKRFFYAMLFAGCLFWTVSVLAAGSMWVTSDEARLKSEPKASSKTLSTVAVGARVSVLESQKRWYRIRTTSGDEGWMYRGKLSDTAPPKETEDSQDLFAAMGNSSISADEAQTSRSIRGLSKETEQYAKQRGTPEAYKKALNLLLAFRVTDNEVDVFLKNGKIGEYAP